MAKIGKKLADILSRDSKRSGQTYNLNDTPAAPETNEQELHTPALMQISDLIPNTLQPRSVFDEAKLDELASSIKKKGVLQPVIYRKTDNGNELIAGERRWRASQLAGLTEIPAIEMQATDEEALELAIIENVQRDDLDPIEKAEGFNSLIKRYNMTQQDVADQLGLSRTSVTNFIRLLQLPDKIKEYVSRETLTMGHARCLLSLQAEDKQIAMADRIAKEGLSVRATEDIVYNRNTSTPNSKSKSKEANPHIRELEKKFVDHFGSKVQINNSSKNKGKIIIHYHNNEDFIRIAGIMGIHL